MKKTASRAAALSLLLWLAACAGMTGGEDKVRLQPVSFASLPGWQQDDSAQALAAFVASCGKLQLRDAGAAMTGGFAGSAADWQGACVNARAVPAGNPAAARAFFENAFNAYAVSGANGRDGLFTGYYLPLLRGSAQKKAPYLTPLYLRPADLVSVDLGQFSPDLKGKSIQGRVLGQNLVPYYTRAEIERGALDKNNVPAIVYVDNAIDAFFLHIQGSGLVQMDDGRTLDVGYAAQNGRDYHAVGKTLVEQGAIAKDQVSMQAIRAWMESHPAQAQDLMDKNDSYVFFRELKDGGPLGAQGVALTPQRSMAVDKSKWAYGIPLYLDAADPDGVTLQRLMVAQDTGGAIKGAVRGDYFWGAGDAAADKAGRMKSTGRLYALLPKTVKVPDTYLR